MPLFTTKERRFAEGIADLMYCNPFLPERIEYERQVLEAEFEQRDADWNVTPGLELHPNVRLVVQRTQQTLDAARRRQIDGTTFGEQDARRYEEMLMLVQYYRFREDFNKLLQEKPEPDQRTGRGQSAKRMYRQFATTVRDYAIDDVFDAGDPSLAHWFAGFFQVRRAFTNIFDYIIGVSPSAVQLRAAVWQSIFTHDMRRYRRVLYRRMGDQTTLITGPSGTGKELIARAVGMSQYVPFDPSAATFGENGQSCFVALHLAAMSPTLIESELFGHHRGAFTGAVSDRAGWLESCPPTGTVFLDELGELDPQLQVKLLRVIQQRTFHRVGETQDRRFEGKLIAATNRELSELIRDGQFRLDLYYRICSDIVRAPSLHERIRQDDRELDVLLTTLAARIVGDEDEALAGEVRQWIDQHLEADYDWPGNVRELEQCLRNVMIRRCYQPLTGRGRAGLSQRGRQERTGENELERLAAELDQISLTADQLLNLYCTLTYRRLGSYQQAAQALGLDRRTLRARVDPDLLNKNGVRS